MEVEHIGFRVSEPISMAKWYAENLGFQVKRQNGDDSTGGAFILDKSGKMLLELFADTKIKAFQPDSESPLTVHLAFASEDIDADIKKLSESGAGFVEKNTNENTGDHIALMTDPWGNSLQIVQRKNKIL